MSVTLGLSVDEMRDGDELCERGGVRFVADKPFLERHGERFELRPEWGQLAVYRA